MLSVQGSWKDLQKLMPPPLQQLHEPRQLLQLAQMLVLLLVAVAVAMEAQMAPMVPMQLREEVQQLGQRLLLLLLQPNPRRSTLL